MTLNYSSKQRSLAGSTSIFLDGLRFLAALVVLVTHARAVWFPERELDFIPSNLSHGAVVVFFVLSGFVIAHTTTHNNRGPVAYAVARLSRLYSIFLPAILITIIISLALNIFSSQVYSQYAQPHLPFRFIISLFFSNEIWFLTSAPIINGPIWSLSYEFWFYVIFGCFHYKTAGLKGLILPGLVCLIAGPKILLMMVMWLLGWLVYHFPRPRISDALSWIFIISLIVIAGYMMIYLPSMPNEVHTTRLHWADKYLSDGIVSLFVAGAFYLLPNGRMNQINIGLEANFRVIADLTFPIYVMHFPLLVLSRVIFSQIDNKTYQFVLSLIFVFICCAVIGYYLERKRYYWNNFFKSSIEFIVLKLSNRSTYF